VGTEETGSTPSQPPGKRPTSDYARQFAVALELPFVLVSAIVVGGLLGYALDKWLHTKPVFLLIFGGIGFYAGLRDLLRRVSRSSDGDR
jgi:ATP synthase protein I